MHYWTRAFSISVFPLLLLAVPESLAQVSGGYIPPRSKSGIFSLHTYAGPNEIRADNYDAVQLGSRAYNIFWHGFESDLPSSDQPNLSCPTGFAMVPGNATEKVARGYHRYRCMSTGWTEFWRQALLEDQAHGIQSVAGIWASPEQYRNAGCQGFVWQPNPAIDAEVVKAGCVPRDDAMDDFEDYINYLAYTYSGQNGAPKISHYVIWNEAGSGAWFDNTPIVPTDRELTIPEMTTWVSKYASMLTRAHTAIQRHTSGVLIHAVLDGHWYHSTSSGQVLQRFSGVIGGDVLIEWDKVHIGSRTVLEGLWALVGLSIDWSISIHPYGEPTTLDPAWMNYANVPALVAFQNQKLVERGVTPSLNRAQEMVFASEVGWDDPNTVCRAHDISVRIPNIVGSTPFMEITNPDGSPNANYPIFASTNPDVWKLSNNHHCCQTQGLGCMPPWQQIAPAGVADVGVGANGSVWIVGTNGAIYRRTGAIWETMPGAASRIDVGPDGFAWVVNSLGQIFRWTGSTWSGLPGAARDIGVGANGSAWIIGTDYGIYRWTGSMWQSVPGSAVRIDVGPDGHPWVTASNGNIYRWTGSLFVHVVGAAQDVSVASDGSVFVIGGWPGTGDAPVYRYAETTGFVPVGGSSGTQISAGAAATLWVIQSSGALYTR